MPEIIEIGRVSPAPHVVELNADQWQYLDGILKVAAADSLLAKKAYASIVWMLSHTVEGTPEIPQNGG